MTEQPRSTPPTRAIIILLWILIAAKTLGFSWIWIDPHGVPFAAPDMFDITDIRAVPLLHWIIAAACQGVTLVLIVYIGVMMTGALAPFAEGRFFSLQIRLHLRRAAQAIIAFAPVSILSRAIVGVALTWHEGEGERSLTVSFHDHDLFTVLVGLVLLAFAHALDRAARQDEDLKGFV